MEKKHHPQQKKNWHLTNYLCIIACIERLADTLNSILILLWVMLILVNMLSSAKRTTFFRRETVAHAPGIYVLDARSP